MTFNEYLTNKYIEEEQIIDDIIPDEFDEWLFDLEPFDIIELAEEWHSIELKKQIEIDEFDKGFAVHDAQSKLN